VPLVKAVSGKPKTQNAKRKNAKMQKRKNAKTQKCKTQNAKRKNAPKVPEKTILLRPENAATEN
jgi:hypothetical protein